MSGDQLIGITATDAATYKVTVNGHGKPVLHVNGVPGELKPAQADELARHLRDAVDCSDRYGGSRR